MNEEVREGQPHPFAFVQGRVVALEISISAYCSSAVLRACYKFADRVYSFLSTTESEGTLALALWSRSGGEVPPGFLGEFCNELADQELRERLAREAGPIRELIVRQAFAEAEFTDEDDDADYEADPLGIAARR